MRPGVRGAVLFETHAQATVEMALVIPVLLVLALIVFNLMVFASAVARFDRVAPDIVVAQGVAWSAGAEGTMGPDASEAVVTQLKRAMAAYDLDIDVVSEWEHNGGGEASIFSLAPALRTYRCTMRYEPWPRIRGIAGVALGAPSCLTHERLVTIDPWRPGVVA